MYYDISLYTINEKSLLTAFKTCSSFRIMNLQYVATQYSSYLNITSVDNPRIGNPAQIQINFTPSILMTPYIAVTFELNF